MYWLYTSACYLFVKLVGRMQVRGSENIPKTGGFIFVANHLSYLDPPCMAAAAMPRAMYFMARHDLFKNKILGFILRTGNTFPVKRDSADISALKEALKRIKMGHGLVLFPEGTRQAVGTAVDPKKGVGFIAEKAHCPVIPVHISGTDKVLPKGARFFRFAKITLVVGKPVPIHYGGDYEKTARLIMQEIRSLGHGGRTK